jgi:four helix bundle protein
VRDGGQVAHILSPNDEFRMTKETPNPNDECATDWSRAEEEFWGVVGDSGVMALRDEPVRKPAYDLEERTAKFGEAILLFAKKIPRGPVNDRLIDQLVGAGTSVGANYCEADDGVSKKDFRNKIGTCKKEARETKFFLRMVATSEPQLKPEARVLWQEAKELHLIFCKIWRS